MAKFADRYFAVDPWTVEENGFDPAHGRVAESVFALANEYMGVRGYFDEGYSGDRLVGVYLNGVFEEARSHQAHYRGIADRTCFMVNTVDWLAVRIEIDGERLDLATSSFSAFSRILDMRTGMLTRSFVWTTRTGKNVRLTFQRALSMQSSTLAGQRMVFEALDFSGPIAVLVGLDFSIVHESRGESLFQVKHAGCERGVHGMLAQTNASKHMVYAGFTLQPGRLEARHNQLAGAFFGGWTTIQLLQGVAVTQDKLVYVHAEKNGCTAVDAVWATAVDLAERALAGSFDSLLAENRRYWSEVWEKYDISIEGDPENLQGIRYSIFQLNQTYHGADPLLNIGAKGLTGEAYNGHAFWDSEIYCLPFYLFTNPPAARHLLEFRYNTLPGALQRAKALDCAGACYPIATLDGTECCDLWQHASLQFQPTTGVAYGIWHYARVTGDKEFLFGHGAEMLVQICRFLATRGQWGPRTGQFGYYCVMGPDEFQMMVHNNAYTNFMARKSFEFTLEVLAEMRNQRPESYRELSSRLAVGASELDTWRQMAAAMRLSVDETTGIVEQHDGFFDLPHIDIDAIPPADFPLYSHWSYDRIYRNDMIKQPDVLMFMFLHNREFSLESKHANFDYYEPRCIHESSLSPSVHSVLAAELGRHRQAFEFFRFATRLDLDNFNRNTHEGLHLTAIAAAWVNIVYGFGGMRSDGPLLAFAPSIPEAWTSYSFRVNYRNAVIRVDVSKRESTFRVVEGDPVAVLIYGHERSLDGRELAVSMAE